MTQIKAKVDCKACKFLGFKNDDKTHIAVPSTRNYCHHLNQPSGISKEMQTSYCLAGKFGECPLARLSPHAKAPTDLLRQPKNRSLLQKLVNKFA